MKTVAPEKVDTTLRPGMRVPLPASTPAWPCMPHVGSSKEVSMNPASGPFCLEMPSRLQVGDLTHHVHATPSEPRALLTMTWHMHGLNAWMSG